MNVQPGILAHVPRLARYLEFSLTPEAYVLRRSMPWASADGEGLVFVSFGAGVLGLG